MILVCTLAAMALPAATAAKPGYYVSEPFRFASFSVAATHGYRLHVFGYSSDQVGILVEKGSTSANYTVTGTVTDTLIRGRFGKLGRVSMRLDPRARTKTEENEPGCKGAAGIAREGRFTGVIRFRGEEGYTTARAESASGFAVRGFRLVCKRRQPRNGGKQRKEPPAISLNATSRRSPLAPWFTVYKQEPDSPVRPGDMGFEDAFYMARTGELRPNMAIVRSASVQAAPETFAVSPLGDVPTTASVAPPPPFSGTASYEKAADGTLTWTGDLAVELPGRGRIPLVGSAFTAKLCRDLSCACPIGSCVFFVALRPGEPRLARLQRLAARVAS